MSTIMGLNYLYLTKAVVNSTGETVYQFDFDIEKVSAALGLNVTQLESADTNYPYYYLIHAGEDTQNGILTMCPMMFTTAQVIFPYAYISRIDATDVNSKYIDMNGKVYIRAVSYSATDNKWLVEFDA